VVSTNNQLSGAKGGEPGIRRRFVIASAASLLVPTVLPPAAKAQGLQGPDLEVSPTSLALDTPGSTTICTVSNNGSVATSAQIRVRAWHQASGQDVLGDTDDVVASPPFMTVGPGQQQIVRVANLSATAGATELAYRVWVNQLPTAGSLTGAGIRVLLAFNIPLFIAGVDASPPQLAASFVRDEGSIVLRLSNSGDVHARVSNLSFKDGGGVQQVDIPGLACYVLAQSTRDLILRLQDLPAPGGDLRLQTQFTRGPTSVPIAANG
jgi:fimbrial chaperone protein